MASKPLPKSVRLSAPRTTVNAARSKTPQVEIVAYTGGVMRLNYLGAVVVDISGLAAGKVALLADHNSRIDGIIGYGTARIENGAVVIRGNLASGPATDRIVALSRDGFEFQASIGAELTRRRYVEPGVTVKVNGKKIVAPKDGLNLIDRAILREVSITALGADANTSVRIAARKPQEAPSMFGRKKDKNQSDGFPGNEIGDTIRPIEAANEPTYGEFMTHDAILEEERKRIHTIDSFCAQAGENVKGSHLQARLSDLRMRAINEEISIDQLRAELVEVVRSSRPSHGAAPPRSSSTLAATAIEAALMVRAGLEKVAETQLGARALEDSRSIHGASMVDLCRAAIVADGRTPPSSQGDLIRAAMGDSTGSMPVALGNAMNKSLIAAYDESPATWRSFAKIEMANNFKEHTSIRPSWMGQLEELAPGGEIKHGSFSESTFNWSVDTFAKVFSFTRRDVINDDLSILQTVAPALATMALRKLSDLVWDTIMANAGSYFSVGNNNLLSGATTALTSLSLAQAFETMATQRDAENNDIDIAPRVLVVQPANATIAKAILNSEELNQTGDNEPTGNPLRKALKLEVESRLSNTAKFSGASDVAWYLFGAPINVPIIVGYLAGFAKPRIEMFDFNSEPSKLSMGYRVYQDFGVAMGDPRAGVKSTGE